MRTVRLPSNALFAGTIPSSRSSRRRSSCSASTRSASIASGTIVYPSAAMRAAWSSAVAASMPGNLRRGGVELEPDGLARRSGIDAPAVGESLDEEEPATVLVVPVCLARHRQARVLVRDGDADAVGDRADLDVHRR